MSTGPIARARMYTFEEPLDVLVTERSSHSITYITRELKINEERP